jgi:hypothetical protein
MSRGFTIRIKDNRIIAAEEKVHQMVVTYLCYRWRGVMFHSDAAGELMTESMRIRQSKVNMQDISFPDLFIAESRRGFFGMFIEIKREDEQLFNKSGLYKNQHLIRQAKTLEMLRERNYHAIFEKGFDQIIKRIDDYLSGPATKFKKPKLK